jgi:geranylgeranyl pyrophosphate synthase
MVPYPREIRHLANEFIQAEILPVVEWPELELSIETWVSSRQGVHTDIWPALTYTATGGEIQKGIPLAALWLLQILAARVFDDIQDGEGLENPWQQRGLEQALPTGIALLTAANICLAHLPTDVETFKAVVQALARAGTLAAKAQSRPPRDWSAQALGPYFEHLIATTGQIFATGAWVGARLNGVTDASTLHALYEFGLNSGMKMAIVSDCADLQPQKIGKLSDLTARVYKLPVLYAMSRTDAPYHDDLLKLLEGDASLTGNRLKEAVSILDEMGAITWSLNIAADFQNRALAALHTLPDEISGVLTSYA